MATYQVVSGDTGNNIAKKLGITFAQLEAANPGVNWTNLQIGQVLQVPGSGSGSSTTTYKVVSGDTGEKIAQKFGISFSQLESANPGVNWNNLSIGQTLNVPTTSTGGGGNSGGGNSGGGGGGSDPGTNGDTTLRQYSGPASSFPNPELWQKFSLMWNNASQAMTSYDTADEINYVQQAINTVAAESNPQVDRRVILCVIMQESSGNVNVQTTISPDGSVRNPGLMQSHNGVAFDSNNPQGSILQMVRDGTEGTSSGDGLTQLLKQYGDIYSALRGYNSGSVNPNNLSDGLGATNSYVSDVANRLLGATPF